MKTLLALLLLTSVTFAHHGPEKSLSKEQNQKIETITESIKLKPTAKLYTQRAAIYFEAGVIDRAKHDLEHALMLDKDFTPAKKLLKKIN